MDTRHSTLLIELIDHYIATGQPISSGYLASVHSPQVSPATVRNALALLEEQGYLQQPHTSAGRVPSEKGYQSYIKEMRVPILSTNVARTLTDCVPTLNRETAKDLARHIADIANEMIYVAFGCHDTYYTGLSHLVRKPEFYDQDLLADITGLIDHLDHVLARVLDSQDEGISTYIGSHSGFGSACSTLVLRYTLDDTPCLLGILGPLRMNYAFNTALLQKTYSIITT